MSWRRLAIASLAALVATAGAAWAWFSHSLEPVDPDGAARSLVIARGSTLAAVAEQLESEGLVRYAWSFELLGRLEDAGAELRAGEYALSPADDAGEILAQLTRGNVQTHPVSVPEGLRASEIADRLADVGLVDRDRFLEAAVDAELVARFGLEGSSFEGYLFPETYHFARGLPVEEVLAGFADQFLAEWRSLAPKAAASGMSMLEVVTLASIVEKETAVPSERPRIAGVFLNRLARDMRLETDPTVIYGIEDFDGNLTRAHLEDADNPYNTYRIRGLPPGPIASPGAAALRAVLEPEEHEFLFFVSRNDGTHVFSNTYREHAAAVDRFQRRR